LFAKSLLGKNAWGANFVLASQNGKNSKKTAPMTNMAIILALLQPPLAFGANVSGSKISEMAAAKSNRPKASKSNQRFLTIWTTEKPLKGLGTSIPSFFARR
jgi:hypothetical protein